MIEWTLSNIRDLLVIAQVVGTMLIMGFLWWMRTTFVSHRELAEILGKREEHRDKQFNGVMEELKGMGRRMSDGDRRFGLIEQNLQNAPTYEQIADLRLSVEKLSGDVRVAVKGIDGMEALHNTLRRQVDVMDEFLRVKS